MAVSLVSTGVQFPDSTIQTTAAASPLGATTVGSTIIVPSGSYGTMGYATNASNSNTPNWTYLNCQPVSNSGTLNFNNGNSYVPVYTSYYGGWLTIMSINNNSSSSPQDWICLSKNGGISWIPIMRGISTSFPSGSFAQGVLYNNKVPVAVDESNGRIWTLGYNNSSYSYFAYYQTTIGSQASTWTQGSFLYSGGGYYQQPGVNAFEYVNMGGVTANSGIVVSGKAYGSGNQVYVIAAGSTTATQRFSGSGPTSNNYGGNMVWSYSGLRAWTLTNNGQGTASVSTNVNQSWTANTNLSPSPGSNATGLMVMSTSYNVYGSSNILYYSTTFGSWTSTTPGVGNFGSLTHNGTYWLLRTSQGLYYSSSATPTGFTPAGWLPLGDSSSSWPIGLRQY